jgi:quinol-cytochrome oxidoreductase complex cytochrome b subunit
MLLPINLCYNNSTETLGGITLWTPFGFILALLVYILLIIIVKIMDKKSVKRSTKIILFITMYLIFKFSMIYNTENHYDYGSSSEYFIKDAIMYQK